MKILISTELLAPYRIAWFNELSKFAEVTVLYTKDKASTRNSNWLTSRSKKCFCRKMKCKLFFNFEIYLDLIKEIKKEYDILILDGYSFPTQILSIIYLKFIKREFFMNIDGGIIKENERFYKKIIKKFFIKSPTYYLSSSKTTDKYLNYYGADKNKIFHHKFTSLYKQDILKIKKSNLEKQILKNKLNIKYEKIIISVGRFIESKGFDILIKSAKLLPSNYGVYIIGGKPTNDYIKILNNNNINNVHFEEFKKLNELKEYYNVADIFVLPTRSDVWGLVINEAMAAGLPIITTDKCVGGLELVKNFKNGFIVPVDNFEILAEKIITILENDDLLYSMSYESLNIIKDYTIENLAKTHINIFNKYLNKLTN